MGRTARFQLNVEATSKRDDAALSPHVRQALVAYAACDDVHAGETFMHCGGEPGPDAVFVFITSTQVIEG